MGVIFHEISAERLLSSCFSLGIPGHLIKLSEELTADDLVAGAKVFAEFAEKAVSEAYAMRLLRSADRTLI
ncbi:hypothetical protein D3C78_1770140 [compost metagenome]